MNKKCFDISKEEVLIAVRPGVKEELERIIPNIKILDVEWCVDGLKVWYLEDMSNVK
jgi:hypothetical protein